MFQKLSEVSEDGGLNSGTPNFLGKALSHRVVSIFTEPLRSPAIWRGFEHAIPDRTGRPRPAVRFVLVMAKMTMQQEPESSSGHIGKWKAGATSRSRCASSKNQKQPSVKQGLINLMCVHTHHCEQRIRLKWSQTKTHNSKTICFAEMLNTQNVGYGNVQIFCVNPTAADFEDAWNLKAGCVGPKRGD
ncbi:hypothetical protein BDK51DRAFT_33173, partial [Blyttiomyces helicus]